MSQPNRGRLIAYWIVTVLIIVSQGLSGIADFFQPEALVQNITALGYPTYVLYILGFWKLAGAITLAIPGKLWLKELAYFGFFLDFTGATASHLLNGDSFDKVAPALVATVVLLISWFLRPPSRRLIPA